MTDPRDLREAGNDLLRALAATFPPEFDVREDRMFNGRGLRTGDAFFAFVGSAGRLVVKLPAADVQQLVADGEASPVTMGKRTMREWVSFPLPDDDATSLWRVRLEAARSFVANGR